MGDMWKDVNIYLEGENGVCGPPIQTHVSPIYPRDLPIRACVSPIYPQLCLTNSKKDSHHMPFHNHGM